MVFRISVVITNPIAQTNRVLDYQFDPSTMTQAKWNGAWPTVKAKIDELTADAATNPNEVPVW